MSISSSVRAASRSARSCVARCHERAPYAHALLRHRRLGPAGQPAARARCTSARAPTGRARRDVLRARDGRATWPARSRASGAARRSSAIDAPSGRAARAARRRARRARPSSACPTAATSACGSATRCSSGAGCRCTRCRPPRSARRSWMEVGFELFEALSPLGRLRAGRRERRARGRGRRGGDALGARCARPTPTRSSARCSATARRPSARRGACQQRIAALKLKRRLRRRRRALAPHARRDRRLRGRLRGLRAQRGPRHLGRRCRRGRDGHPDRPPAPALRSCRRRRAPSWPETRPTMEVDGDRRQRLHRTGSTAGLLHRCIARRATTSPS